MNKLVNFLFLGNVRKRESLSKLSNRIRGEVEWVNCWEGEWEYFRRR